MSIPYGLASYSDPEIDSGSDNDEMYVNEGGFQFPTKREPAGSEKETLLGENGGLFKCEKCDVKYLGPGALHHHKLSGNQETAARKHFYCGKCRIDFKDESELKGHVMKSAEHVVCSDCGQEFPTVGELELHSKEVNQPKPATTHGCPGCNVMFTSISGVTQHIESGQCQGKLSAGEFRNLINNQNNPLAKKGLPEDILAGTTSTHTWRAGILPPRVKAALAGTPGGFKPDELVPKDFVSVLDHTLPAKPASSPMENPRECWSDMFEAYVCPRPKCRKKFRQATALKAHLESAAHEKKSFRCPTCFCCFVSSSALIQHAESETCGVKKSPAYAQLIKGATGGLMDGGKKPESKTGW